MPASKSKPARSPCPVACTLDILGDKWTLLIVRDLHLGRSLFRDFQASPERIASNILANRLARLVEHGLVETFPSERKAGTDAYRLTDKGKQLKPLLDVIVDWGLKHIEGTEARLGTG